MPPRRRESALFDQHNLDFDQGISHIEYTASNIRIVETDIRFLQSQLQDQIPDSDEFHDIRDRLGHLYDDLRILERRHKNATRRMNRFMNIGV